MQLQQQQQQQMHDSNFGGWEDERSSMRHRSSSITGLSYLPDWNHFQQHAQHQPGYPRPMHHAYPAGRRPPEFGSTGIPQSPMGGAATAGGRFHTSAWDLSMGSASINHHPASMYPVPMNVPINVRTSPMHQMQQAQSMNWRGAGAGGMWPAAGEMAPHAWDQHAGLHADGSMKRTLSNQSMAGADRNAHMINMWAGGQMHPSMMHPQMFPPYHLQQQQLQQQQQQQQMAMMQQFNVSQNQLTGGFDGQRCASPACSQRSHGSHKQQPNKQQQQQLQQQRTDKERNNSSSSQRKKSWTARRWSDSDDEFERFSGDDDVSPSVSVRLESNPKQQQQQQRPKEKQTHWKTSKDYGRASPMTERRKEVGGWQCDHCTFVNDAGSRVCAVCCRTSTAVLETSSGGDGGGGGGGGDVLPASNGSSIEYIDDEPVVKSNLSFKIKDGEAAGESIGVQMKNERMTVEKANATKVYADAVKDYEDVSNMLKRMRLKKEEKVTKMEEEVTVPEKKAEATKATKESDDDNQQQTSSSPSPSSKSKERETYYEQVQYQSSSQSSKSTTSSSTKPTPRASQEGNYYIYSGAED